MRLYRAVTAFAALFASVQPTFGTSNGITGGQSDVPSQSLSQQPPSVHRGPFDRETGFFHFGRPQRLGRKLEQALRVSPQQVIAQMREANQDNFQSSPLASLPGSPVGSTAKPSRARRLSHSSSYHSALAESLPSTPRTPTTPSLREHSIIAEHRPKGGRWRKVTRKLTACLRCAKPRGAT
ncbi:hypothetical protein BCV69DRAFT_577 [Microstroma glucosiphilum]|uniref:Secreted protein n=1 Tax=Pseudomicrostroma glucosiphilum TaxID=1684307 RepID=A0A316UE45_9BASI|nr:hypothetical protein BCV69DRAFT_577 [Pseudomicrostroma glucosiphilum]PWN23489.1 hypothetical protein BCV69DRAFT_577 [Pseudomicrostroma glucosiphilum]